MSVAVLPPTVLVCPNCNVRALKRTDVEVGFGVSEMHDCAGLAGLTAPLVPEGLVCKVEAIEREDYLGDDAGHVRLDGHGVPMMSVVVTRDESNDTYAFAPRASVEVRN